MPPHYCALTPERIPEALQLMRTFYMEEALMFNEGRALPALQQMAGDPHYGVFTFIEIDGRAVGYFVLTLCFSLEFGGRFALLDEFFMLPDFRGRGIGAHALGEVERTGRHMGVVAIRLEVDRFDPGLHAFYKRAGFALHERDLMTKWLPA